MICKAEQEAVLTTAGTMPPVRFRYMGGMGGGCCLFGGCLLPPGKGGHAVGMGTRHLPTGRSASRDLAQLQPPVVLLFFSLDLVPDSHTFRVQHLRKVSHSWPLFPCVESLRSVFCEVGSSRTPNSQSRPRDMRTKVRVEFV